MAKIKLRRDTYQNWYDANPVLALGEPAYDTTNNKLKIGDGTAHWRSLSYLTDVQGTDGTYTPTTPADWTGSPTVGTVVQGLDELASRVTSVEGGGTADTGNFGFSGNVAYNSNSYDEGLYIAPGGESTSYLFVPGNSESTSPVQLTNSSTGGVQLQAGNEAWLFRADNILENSNTFTKTIMSGISTTAPTVVWTASQDYISGVKLMIQVESFENGDGTGWHSQVCEAIIASRGYAQGFAGPGGTPVMTVYGVTYTSTVPLVTFTVQRNPTTKFIEVVGTLTAAANPTSADLRIYSVETATND